MLSSSGLWFHSNIELLLFQGLYFIDKNTAHRVEQQVSYVTELVHYITHVPSFNFRYFMLTTIYTCSRGMSSAHAIFITAVSLYLVMSTDLFSDHVKGPITFRNSIISTSALGVLNIIYHDTLAFLLFFICFLWVFILYMMSLHFIFELHSCLLAALLDRFLLATSSLILQWSSGCILPLVEWNM